MSRQRKDPVERALDAVMALSPEEAAVFDRIIALKDRIRALKEAPLGASKPRRQRKAKAEVPAE